MAHNRCSQCGHSPRSKWHITHCLHQAWRKHPHSGRHAPQMRTVRIPRGHAESVLLRWSDPDPIQVNISPKAEVLL